MGGGNSLGKNSFRFMLGTVFGIYVAQNYDVPSVQKLLNTGVLIAKFYEANYRKSRKKDDDDY